MSDHGPDPLDNLLDAAEASRAGEGWKRLAIQEYQVIRFRAGGRELALPIDAVDRTERIPMLTAVPLSPSFVRGVASLRGGVVCVLDLLPLLGEGSEVADLGESRSMLIVHENGRRVGLLCDNLPDFQRVGRFDTVPVPAGELDIYQGALRGEGLIGILDPSKLVELVEQRLHGSH